MSLSDIGITEDDAQYILGSFLHAWILQIFLYGIYTMLFFVALYLTLRRGHVGSSILISAMWILVTINTGVLWAGLDYSFIKNADNRETQLISITTVESSTLPRQLICLVVTFLSVLLVDLTMMWRCWILYGRRWFIVVIPMLSLATGTVSHIFRGITRLTTPELAATYREVNWELIFLSTTVFTNTFCTAAIVARVVSIVGLAHSLKTYRGILEIFIESAVMYTIVYLVWIGLQVHSVYLNPEWDQRVVFPTAMANILVGVAPTLIIARIAAGYSRPDDNWAEATGSLPHFKQAPCKHLSLSVTDTQLGLKSGRSGEPSSGCKAESQWEEISGNCIVKQNEVA